MAVRLWTLEKLGDVAALRGVLKKTVEGKQQNQTVHHARPKRAPATAHRLVGVDRCEAGSAAGDSRAATPQPGRRPRHAFGATMTGRRTKQEGANNHNIAQVPMLFTLTGAPGKHRQQQCVTLGM